MDALYKENMYTIEDIYALPEGERAELIDEKFIRWHRWAEPTKG